MAKTTTKKKKACGFSSGFAKMKTRHFAAPGCRAPEIFFSLLFEDDALAEAAESRLFQSNKGLAVTQRNHLSSDAPAV